MADRVSKDNYFVDGAARGRDLVYFITKDRELGADDTPHALLLSYDEGEWYDVEDTNWNAAAICVAKKPAEKMVAIGEDGEVHTFVGGKDTEEQITPAPTCLCGMNVVEGFPVACGMKRQAYLRKGENSWVDMHAPEPKEGENAGFEAIAGFALNEIYAAGWSGEIWQYNGKKWLNRTSPTNLILTGICCAPDEKVYICGQHGTLLRGRRTRWELIDLGDFTRDFWDLHWFNDKLYLATMSALFTLTNSGLMPVDFGDDEPATCYRLTSAEGVLWSVGSDDVFSFDGTSWTRVD